MAYGGREGRPPGLSAGKKAAIAVAAFLGLGSCGGFIVAGVRASTGPINATHIWFDAIQRGDYVTAVAHECPLARLVLDTGTLRQDFGGDPILSWHAHGFEIAEQTDGPRTARVDGTLRQESGSTDIAVYLQRYGGHWLVCAQNGLDEVPATGTTNT
jgi:hypothetical protein